MKRLIALAAVTVFAISIETLVVTVSCARYSKTQAPQQSEKVVFVDFEPTEKAEQATAETATEQAQNAERKEVFICTAYCACEKCCGKWAKNRPKDETGAEVVLTASGAQAVEGITVAADTSVLPFGTKVEIDGNVYEVQDCGGAIKGNRIDIYFDNHETALAFGKQTKTVTIIESEG